MALSYYSEELKKTAAAIARPGKGILAVDESTKTVGKRLASIDVENTAMGHDAVAEAAVIGVQHPKWTERPLLVIIPAEGYKLTKDEILGWLEGKIANWWIPDDVVFVDEIPHTATGKIKKVELRKQFADYKLPL